MVSLQKIEQAVDGMPVDELPDIIGGLARLQAKANVRLLALGQTSPLQPTEEYFSVKEVAKYTKNPDQTIYALVRENKIPFGRKNGSRKLEFQRTQIDEWMAAQFQGNANGGV